ncbi:MBL fold metallo-hydrolase [Arthrobacter humicola]
MRQPDGLIIIDAGIANSPDGGRVDGVGRIEAVLDQIGANWHDISDVIVTHAQRDHYGTLGEVSAKLTPTASVWAGEADIPDISRRTALTKRIKGLGEGSHVRKLRVLSTPGHTLGHICLLHDEASVLFMGDLVDTLGGQISRPPANVTAKVDLAVQSLVKVAELDVSRVLFSHGGETSKPISTLRNFLASTSDHDSA